jgi:hypothetical protein
VDYKVKNEPNRRRLLFEQEVADMANISLSNLRHSRLTGPRKGRLSPPPYILIGRSVRYRLEDVEAWLMSLRRGHEETTLPNKI